MSLRHDHAFLHIAFNTEADVSTDWTVNNVKNDRKLSFSKSTIFFLNSITKAVPKKVDLKCCADCVSCLL